MQYYGHYNGCDRDRVQRAAIPTTGVWFTLNAAGLQNRPRFPRSIPVTAGFEQLVTMRHHVEEVEKLVNKKWNIE